MTEKKYIYCREAGWDSDSRLFDTGEEAASYAESAWEHLTEREKRGVRIYSAVILPEYLNDTAVDEETGEIDWDDCNGWDDYPGCFDSAVYEEQKYLKEIAVFIADEGEEEAWQRSDEDDRLYIFNGVVEYDRSLWACRVTCRGSVDKYSVESYDIRRA